ncbi:MAG: T9SS type A sorting domain-containing protein [Bacteroidia bacterium]|nr:T9SS type A sorting domain-containing protein [Bacteroidia bacterium]
MNFTGTINTGSKSLTLTRTAGKSSEGFNLVANPYPSYLDWKMVSAANSGLLTTTWFRTKNATGGYIFATVNVADPLNPTIVAVNPTTTITTLIPPMQAYWVRVISGSTTYNIDNSMRKHVDDTRNKLKALTLNSQQMVRLQVSNGTNADEAVLLFNSKASDYLDTFDSPKMSNNSAAIPELYTKIDSEKLVINGMKSVTYDTEIPLGFTTGQASDFTISTTEMTNFEVGTRLFLKDKLLNKETEIGEGLLYNFSSQTTTATSDRFSLIFKSPSSFTRLDNDSKLNAQVYVNAANLITIIAPEKSSYAVYNSVGQKVAGGLASMNRTIITHLNQTGIYIVKVSENGKVNSTRVLLNTK